MTPLAAFGICILITLLLILILTIVTGGGFQFLFYMITVAAIEEITRKIGLGRKGSVEFTILLWLFIALEIIFVSAVFFGMLSLFYSFSTIKESVELMPRMIAAKHPFFIDLNKILLLTLVYFSVSFIYYRIKFGKTPKADNVQIRYPSPILPVLSFVCGFTYLITAYYYLINFPLTESVGVLATITGALYTLYLIYSLGKTIYIFIRYRSHIFPAFTFTHAFRQLISLAYNITFLYFFYNTAYMLKFY